MTSLSLLNYGEIRVNDQKQFSIFDTIEVVGGKLNPREAWNSLVEKFPEILSMCDNFQFPGARQRLTPVASTQGIFYIIGLLPGAIGQSYREDAAREMCKKFNINYSTNVATESDLQAPLTPLDLANLELSQAIAAGITASHKAAIAKLNHVENLIQGSTVDVKGEIREGNHTLSEQVKYSAQDVIDAFMSGVDDLKAHFTAKPEEPKEKKAPKKPSFAVNINLSPENYEAFCLMAEQAGISKSAFGAESLAYLFRGQI